MCKSYNAPARGTACISPDTIGVGARSIAVDCRGGISAYAGIHLPILHINQSTGVDELHSSKRISYVQASIIPGRLTS